MVAAAKLERGDPHVIRTRGLSVAYGQKLAVKDVSLEIRDREVIALIGPSGCGKSTFLRSLNRMNDTVDDVRVTGSVELLGHDIYGKDVDPVLVRRHVGMVFQRPNPLAKSIFDNVAYGLRVAGIRDKKVLTEKVTSALDSAALLSEVKDRLHESALSLSGGQQQRLCVARALACEPSVLLMDEPASALDPISTEKVEELVVELAKRLCIVIVTHSMNQAIRVAHRTAFFYLGELVELAPTKELFESPRQERTRNYVTGRFG
jgi:phosphate transport system ATP-binding protein